MNKACNNIGALLPFLKVVSDENRLKILCFLKSGEKCVCDIVDFLEVPQNLVSHHLKKLKDAGILTSKKEGLKVIYSINNAKVLKNIEGFNSLFK